MITRRPHSCTATRRARRHKIRQRARTSARQVKRQAKARARLTRLNPRRAHAGGPARAGDQSLPQCNGIGASLELLQPFVDALDPRREVVRFDMPGIGGSPAPVVPYHLWTLAPLLSGLLDQLGHQQADVLGVSWGGGLARQFAVRCPSPVPRLVLVATSPGALMVPGHPRALLRMLTPP